jgi:monoamine oxidase
MATVTRYTRRSVAAAGATAALIGACTRAKAPRKDADVIIVGAGLSGLFAAMTLKDAGLSCLVIEASPRIGGRLWTLDDLPGRPEAGGEQVGRSYARVRYAAAETGVQIIDREAAPRDPRVLFIGDKPIQPADWAGAPENPFPDEWKSAPPDLALLMAAARDNPFQTPQDWRTAAADVSAADYLAQRGFDEASRRLIDISLNANALDTYSMINVWRTAHIFAADSALGPSGDIAGGSQRLPEAMADRHGAVSLGESVRAIEADANGVSVATDKRRLRADFCIIATPFPALRGMAISPALPALQSDAILNLPYTQILQLHLSAEQPFWTSDGLPPAMWTDGPLERIFPVRDGADIVGLTAWINGEHARVLALRDNSALEALAQSELRRLRPASVGAVKLRKAIRWTEQGSTTGGAYMHFAPGEVAKWAPTMGAPAGRLFFAGEHLSYLHTGMEGACEAGHNAALAILDRIGAP